MSRYGEYLVSEYPETAEYIAAIESDMEKIAQVRNLNDYKRDSFAKRLMMNTDIYKRYDLWVDTGEISYYRDETHQNLDLSEGSIKVLDSMLDILTIVPLRTDADIVYFCINVINNDTDSIKQCLAA